MSISIKTSAGASASTIGSVVKLFVKQENYESPVVDLNGKTYLMSGTIMTGEEANYPEAFSVMSAGMVGRFLDAGLPSPQVSVTNTIMWADYVNDAYFVVVLVGSNYYLMRSTDGLTWAQTSVVGSTYSSRVVYSNGVYLWYAGQAGYMYYSTDGINWVNKVIQATNGNDYGNLSAGGGRFVALSRQGTAGRYSVDGINWTAISTTTGMYYPDVLIYNEGRFFQIGGLSGSTQWSYSTDGITWVGGTIPTAITGTTTSSYCYYAFGKLFVVTSTGRRLIVSNDNGANWSTAESSIFTDNVISTMYMVGSTLYAVFTSGLVYTTTTGVTWALFKNTGLSVTKVARAPTQTLFARSQVAPATQLASLSFDSAIENIPKVTYADERLVEFVRIK